ncbi:MAG TPA: DUF6468 domain-containing protein [Alphaproteobacteria bacterium]|nr:DUF6468 domain-containing protein [Alphaproteobacteria bacterium]
MTYDIGFILDGLILVFLSVTIFYAARLSLFLKSFREGKNGIQLLIRDLSLTVDKAEESVQTMKQHALQTEQELREIIHEAKFLSDELRFMNQTGDSLADRLEKLADRNRELVDLMENAGGIGTQKIMPFDPAKAVQPKKQSRRDEREEYSDEDIFEISDFDVDMDDEHDFMALSDGAYREEDIPSHKSKVNTESKSKVRSFAIFDKDFVSEDDDTNGHFEDKQSKFHSRAEQDLYEALQRKKRVSEIS